MSTNPLPGYDEWLERPYYDEKPEKPERDPDQQREEQLDRKGERENEQIKKSS